MEFKERERQTYSYVPPVTKESNIPSPVKPAPKPSTVPPKPSNVPPKPSNVPPKPSNIPPKPSNVPPKPSPVKPASKPSNIPSPKQSGSFPRGMFYGPPRSGYLEKLGIFNRQDWKQWLLKNHPDKGGNAEITKLVVAEGRRLGY